MYLMNYARDANELLRFVQAAYGVLKPGGRFVGFNDNVLNVPGGTVSYARYGFEKVVQKERRPGQRRSEGDPIVYRFMNDDGTRFEFSNYYLSPMEPIDGPSKKPALPVFRWVDPQLHPSERDNGYWDEFMAAPPIVYRVRERSGMCTAVRGSGQLRVQDANDANLRAFTKLLGIGRRPGTTGRGRTQQTSTSDLSYEP